MKEIRYNVSQSVWIADGKKKVIANEEKGRRGPKKDAHLKTPSLMCQLSPRFQQKKKPNRPRGFCRTPPPLPRRGSTRNPPSPLTDHVVCVPSLSTFPRHFLTLSDGYLKNWSSIPVIESHNPSSPGRNRRS